MFKAGTTSKNTAGETSQNKDHAQIGILLESLEREKKQYTEKRKNAEKG